MKTVKAGQVEKDKEVITLKEWRKMKRQGLVTSIRELKKITRELEKELTKQQKEFGFHKSDMSDMKWELGIINKSGLSDEWRFE